MLHRGDDCGSVVVTPTRRADDRNHIRTQPTELLASEVDLHEGPPVAIRFSMERNLHKRYRQSRTYLEACKLADGQIRFLQHEEFRNAHIVDGLKYHLQFVNNSAAPWRLVIES
jgi:hypothetical protein